MHRDVRSRLRELNLELPNPVQPKWDYVPGVQWETLLFISGQTPKVEGELAVVGRCGSEVDLEAAREAARLCALNALAAVDSILGLDRVARIVKLNGFVASGDGFLRHPEVVDAASGLLIDVFGSEIGSHARTSVGVAWLPGNAPVELELVVGIEQ